MSKIKETIKKFIHPFFILCMLTIIISGIVIIHNSRQAYATEEWVCEYLKKSNYNLSDLDIQVLTQNLAFQIDKKLAEIDSGTENELTRGQLMTLLAMVNEELQYAKFNIPQEEIVRISSDIVKKVVSENMSAFYATSHKEETDEIIAGLEAELLEIRTAIEHLENNKNNLSEQQIKEIAKNAGLDEEIVKNWIREIHSSSMNKYDEDIQELTKLLDTDSKTLKSFLEQAEQQDDSIEYLANRLEITEERLKAILEQTGSSDNRQLLELAARLKAAEAELQNQINSDRSLITNSITSVQQQIINNKNVTDETILENKQDALSAITANKENTDAAIQELQKNVLFYEYDEETNTLKIFGYQ